MGRGAIEELALGGPVVLTTRTLGGATGVSQAALDTAWALSQLCAELRIRAWVPRYLPTEVDGRTLGPCSWEPVSPFLTARSILSGEAPPRALLEQTRLSGSWLRKRFASGAPPALELVNGLGAHALFVGAARGTSAARWLVVHESPRHFDQPGRLDLPAALRALRSYDRRVYVSERGQLEWDELAGLDPSRSLYIPNCVREQRVANVTGRSRSQLRESLGATKDRVSMVCVGQVSPRKGQDIVLDALDTLGPRASGIELDVLGDCRSDWARALRARAQAGSLNVRFLGRVGDVYERVYAADVLVLASRAEAAPLVVLEAMALGTCVVAADVDGVAEQVVHEQTGLLFAREDPHALAGQLARVLGDSGFRERLALAGRARYLERYSRDRQLSRWRAALLDF